MADYAKPAITVIGSLHELTLSNNKIGPNSDHFSAATDIIGSIVPVQP